LQPQSLREKIMIKEVVICDKCKRHFESGEYCFSDDERHYCLTCVDALEHYSTQIKDINFSLILKAELLKVS
jgi:aromatic ring-opening dioxygenase LigB subunit